MNNKLTKNDWAHNITETSSPIIGATGINPMTQDLLHIGVRVIDSSGKERMVHPFWGIRGLNNALEQFVGTEEKQQQEQPDNATTWRRLLEENQIQSNDAPELHYDASTGEWVPLTGDETQEELDEMSSDDPWEQFDEQQLQQRKKKLEEAIDRQMRQAEVVEYLREQLAIRHLPITWGSSQAKQLLLASKKLKALTEEVNYRLEHMESLQVQIASIEVENDKVIVETATVESVSSTLETWVEKKWLDEDGSPTEHQIKFRKTHKGVRPVGWVFNPAWKTDKIHQPKFLPPGAMVQKTPGCNPGRGICNCGSLTPTEGYINADNGEFVPHYKKWKVKNLVMVWKRVWSKKWNGWLPDLVPAKVVRNIRNYGTETDPRTGRKRAKTHKDACWFQPSFGVKQHKAKVIEFAAPTTATVELFDVEAQGQTTDVKAEAEQSAGEARAYGEAVATISLF